MEILCNCHGGALPYAHCVISSPLRAVKRFALLTRWSNSTTISVTAGRIVGGWWGQEWRQDFVQVLHYLAGGFYNIAELSSPHAFGSGQCRLLLWCVPRVAPGALSRTPFVAKLACYVLFLWTCYYVFFSCRGVVFDFLVCWTHAAHFSGPGTLGKGGGSKIQGFSKLPPCELSLVDDIAMICVRFGRCRARAALANRCYCRHASTRHSRFVSARCPPPSPAPPSGMRGTGLRQLRIRKMSGTTAIASRTRTCVLPCAPWWMTRGACCFCHRLLYLPDTLRNNRCEIPLLALGMLASVFSWRAWPHFVRP